MMNLKQGLDALIERTMALASDVKRNQPVPDLPDAVRVAEQALADMSESVTPPATLSPMSERDEIRECVNKFKAHQEKMAREHEDYYLQMKAKMLAPVDPAFVPLRKNPLA